MESLYEPCAACGFPTVLLCHVCRKFICFDCSRPCRACHLKRMAVALLGAGLVLPNPGSGCQVTQWRAAHGARLDEDFAFAYHSELTDVLVDARCRRPRGELTSARQKWQASVRRLVGNHATTSAEASASKNAIRTLQELCHFQILRGRTQGLEEVDPVDLDAFLHGGTSAPT